MRIVVVDTKAFKTTVFGKDRIREVSRWENYQKVLGKRILFKESEWAKNLLTSPENAFRTKIGSFDAKKGDLRLEKPGSGWKKYKSINTGNKQGWKKCLALEIHFFPTENLRF